MRSPSAYIGIDLGTSGVRALAIDENGNEIAESAVSLPPPQRDDAGKSEQNPELWWEAVVAVLKSLIPKLAAYEPCGLAVDGTSATLLIGDGQGRPLSPALMYDDTRSRSVLPIIRNTAPAESAVHSASSGLAKLIFLYPAVKTRRRIKALHQADWILGRLTGRYGITDENNALKLGYDAVERRWPDWMERFGFPASILPEVHPAGTVVGRVSRAAARVTGLPGSCRVATGTTDSTAAALASGIEKPGEAVTSLGSTLVVKVLSAHPIFEADSGIYSHRIGNLWLAGGASNSGGAVLARYFTTSQMEELSRRINPLKPTNLGYYPLLAPGERFPINDPCYLPRLLPRPEDDTLFFQGLLEGIAEIEKLGYTRLAELGAPVPTRVVTSGGGADNEIWRRIRACYLDISVEIAEHRQAAYGSARLARMSLEQASR
ncbi:FGGY-family carbohydrate kinase [Methylocaldum sp.]|uniref:FGGY-family carbohydrate kinase n=1 Tax=Methylocaldum sp. TaxID=1969727 RepID=UPI002D3C52D0|nr:FGGY-family carbohydrate kinase [Methylocaldum sp.]HYE35116.1 FGGY-family carbohydrate kinase [Methylocaldum sp.]